MPTRSLKPPIPRKIVTRKKKKPGPKPKRRRIVTKPYVKQPKPAPPVDLAKVAAAVREIERSKAEAIRRGADAYGLTSLSIQ